MKCKLYRGTKIPSSRDPYLVFWTDYTSYDVVLSKQIQRGHAIFDGTGYTLTGRLKIGLCNPDLLTIRWTWCTGVHLDPSGTFYRDVLRQKSMILFDFISGSFPWCIFVPHDLGIRDLALKMWKCVKRFQASVLGKKRIFRSLVSESYLSSSNRKFLTGDCEP